MKRLVILAVLVLGCSDREATVQRLEPPSSHAPSVLVPVTFEELVRGSVATEETVEELADTTAQSYGSSTAPHLLTVEPSVLTEDDLLALLAESPWPRHEWPTVVRVAYCESRFQPEAVGDGGRAEGLMQIRTDVWHRLARSFDLMDARDNLTAAYVAYLEAGGWWPWSCA